MKVQPDEEEEEEVIPYSAYVDDLEVGVVFNRIDEFMKDLHEDDMYTRFRVALSLFSVIFCLLGIFLIFLGGAMTVAFQSQPKLIFVQVIGGLFQIPIIFWFIFMCCPSKEEREKRRIVTVKRKIRTEKYSENDTKLIEETKDEIKKRVKEEKQQAFAEMELKIAAKKANPLGYPVP
jgi:amino acid permease